MWTYRIAVWIWIMTAVIYASGGVAWGIRDALYFSGGKTGPALFFIIPEIIGMAGSVFWFLRIFVKNSARHIESLFLPGMILVIYASFGSAFFQLLLDKYLGIGPVLLLMMMPLVLMTGPLIFVVLPNILMARSHPRPIPGNK